MSAPTASRVVKTPPLHNGDHLDSDEFESRAKAEADRVSKNTKNAFSTNAPQQQFTLK